MTEAMGIGPHAMWGFSPAQDLLEGYLKQRRHAADDDTPVNILVVNPADVRHLLRTVATRRRHFAPGKGRPVHVSVVVER
jgi:dynein assembly factor 3, axonemal